MADFTTLGFNTTIKSKALLLIIKLLNLNNVIYKTEYLFYDLITDKGGHLRFDFAIFDKDGWLLGLVLYHGIQHYELKDDKLFGKYQREYTDQMKIDYCHAKKIKLYVISYTDNIEKAIIAIIHTLHANPVPSP